MVDGELSSGDALRLASAVYLGAAIGASTRMVSFGRNVIVQRTDAMDQRVYSLKDLNSI